MMKEEAPAPEGGAPEEGQGGGSPGEAIAGIAESVNEGLNMLGQVFQKVGAPPQAIKKLGAIAQAFQQTLSELMQGGGGGEQPAPEGIDSADAGGNPNARPAY